MMVKLWYYGDSKIRILGLKQYAITWSIEVHEVGIHLENRKWDQEDNLLDYDIV